MNPDKVDRTKLERLTDLPNIGPAIAADLRLLGIERSNDLAGQSPLELYHMLSTIKGKRQDPCLLDVLISITRFIEGEEPRPWWVYDRFPPPRNERFDSGNVLNFLNEMAGEVGGIES